LVKYWNKFTEMHGQQNVKKQEVYVQIFRTLCTPRASQGYSTQIGLHSCFSLTDAPLIPPKPLTKSLCPSVRLYACKSKNLLSDLYQILSSFGILRSVEWLFLTDVSGQHIGSIFKGQAVKGYRRKLRKKIPKDFRSHLYRGCNLNSRKFLNTVWCCSIWQETVDHFSVGIYNSHFAWRSMCIEALVFRTQPYISSGGKKEIHL